MTKKTELEKLHERGELMLMSAHNSRLVPMAELARMAQIINDAYAAGEEAKLVALLEGWAEGGLVVTRSDAADG